MSGEGLIAEARAVHQSVGHARLKELMHRGTEFLGCDVAIMGGAMSWVSERNLVSAISNAGGFGVIACGAMTPELLDTEITETKARTKRPFGVNLITMHPQLSELVDTCVKHEMGHIVLAGGLPPGWAIEKIKAMIVTGEKVPLRIAAGEKSGEAEEVSWDVVTLVGGLQPGEKFQQVKTSDGTVGFVATTKLRSLLDYRLIASSRDGKWSFTSLVAGD